MEYQRTLSASKAGDLVIEDILKKGEGFKVNQELIDLFKDETISVANSLMMGMQIAIDSFLNEENDKRAFETLKTTFLD